MHILTKQIKINKFPFTHRMFFCSDLHLGTKKCDLDKLNADLSLAKSQSARIIIPGDIFNAIFKEDKRHENGDTIQDINRAYCTVTRKYGEKILKPYAKYIDMIGEGNHDNTIVKKHGVALVYELCEQLKVPYAGYSGFFTYEFYYQNEHVKDFDFYYHHGGGKTIGASRGISGFAKNNTWIENVDLIVKGHLHAKLLYTDTVVDRDTERTRLNLQLGSYMRSNVKENEMRSADYVEESELPPQPLGGYMVSLRFLNPEKVSVTVEDRYDL